MTLHSDSESSLQDWLAAIDDGSITSQQIEQLSKLLAENAAARKQYLEHMGLLGQLAVTAKRSELFNGGSKLLRKTEANSSPTSHVWRRTGIVAAVALLLFIGSFLIPRFWGRSTTDGVAMLKSQDGWWEHPGLGTEFGEPIQVNRWLHLETGTAVLLFTNGVEMILRGDTTIKIVAPDLVRLFSGTASFVVPEEAIGFKVSTSAADVVDFGTEFTVRVHDAEVVDIQVHQGIVEVMRSGKSGEKERRRLKTRDAVRVDPLKKGFIEIEPVEVPEAQLEDSNPRIIAYRTRKMTKGEQPYHGKLGHDFVVNEPIEVTRLGVFDSESDGLKQTIVCELWQRDDRGTPDLFTDDIGLKRLAVMKFAPGEQAELVDSNRFQALKTPLRLEPGAYSIVAYGYGAREPNGNDGLSGNRRHLKSRNDGGGLISFTGTSRYERLLILDHAHQPLWESDPDSFPAIVDDTFVDRYSAATFEYRRVR
tara:strand:- start:919 stop:2352 length:1434 start_codon:yes stop_codon:yes gene_type:complete